jgi:hypothetical protein
MEIAKRAHDHHNDSTAPPQGHARCAGAPLRLRLPLRGRAASGRRDHVLLPGLPAASREVRGVIAAEATHFARVCAVQDVAAGERRDRSSFFRELRKHAREHDGPATLRTETAALAWSVYESYAKRLATLVAPQADIGAADVPSSLGVAS